MNLLISGRQRRNQTDEFLDKKVLDLTFSQEDGILNSGFYQPMILTPAGSLIVTESISGHDAFDFGASRFLRVPYAPAISVNQPELTKEAWIIRDANVFGALWGQDTWGSNYDDGLEIYPDGRIVVMSAGTTQKATWNLPASEMLNNIGLISHFAITKVGNMHRFWYNGVEVGSAKSLLLTNASNHLMIGCTSWNNPSSKIRARLLRYRYTQAVRYTENGPMPSLDI